MKNILKKTGLILIGFSIVFMLGNCGGGGEDEGEGKSETAEVTKETANKKSTTSKDAGKSTETVTKYYNLEKGYYYTFFSHIQIPVITNYNYIYEKSGDRTKDIKEERKHGTRLVLIIENVKLDGNKFSGTTEHGSSASPIINKENWNSWEGCNFGRYNNVYRCSGEFSEDGKIIKYLEVESLWFQHSGEKKGSYSMGKRRNLAILENIPILRIDEQNIQYKKFQYKNKPTCKVYGENYFLAENRELVSSITEVDYIDYNAKRTLHIHRDGHIIADNWEENNENFSKVDLEKIAENPDIYSGTFIFRQEKKIQEQVPHVSIEGPDTVCRCVGKERSTKNKPCRVKLIAKSDITGGSYDWECDSEAILLQSIEGKNDEIRVRALVDYLPSPESVLIKVTQKIGVVECSATHVLHLRGGYYYFWPDCGKLYELGIITKSEFNECEDDLDKCEDSLRLADVHDEKGNLIIEQDGCNQELAVKYLQLILEEHLLSASGLVDPDTKLDSEKLNWFYKLWDENGDPYPEEERAQPREFVKQLPCMKKWVELGNRKK